VHGLVKGPEGNGQRPPDGQAGLDEARLDESPGTGVMPIGSLTRPGRAVVEGRVRVVEIKPVERNSVLSCEISDGTGQLTAMFYGRSHIPGIVCGARVRFRGSVGLKNGHPIMINPAYELLFPSV
jgi:RecG-like helicase